MSPSPARRGIALVLSLMALSLLSVTGLGLLQTATNHVINADLVVEHAQVEALLNDLVTLAPVLVSAEDVRAPDERSLDGSVRVIDQQVGSTHVRVDRLDLSGRLYVSMLRSFAADGLPRPLNDLGPRLATRSGDSRPAQDWTLDELADVLDPLQQQLVRPFPVTPEAGQVTLADWVTPHGDGSLNIQSAPIPLLRAALHGLDPTASTMAISARLHGEEIPDEIARQLIVERRRLVSPTGSRAIPLATDARALAFHITISQQTTCEQWWIVLEHSIQDKTRAREGSSLRRPVDPDRGSWQVTRWRRIG